EADVVLLMVDTERVERIEVELLNVQGRRFQHHLVLIEVLESVRVVAVAAVGRASARRQPGYVPRRLAQRTQERRRVEGSGADLGVVGGSDDAATLGPVVIESEDYLL